MAILCSFENLNLSFGPKIIFRGCKLSINSGDKIGLIGLNGRGKSCLFKVLSGVIDPSSSSDFVFSKATGTGNNFFSVFHIKQNFSIADISILDYFDYYYSKLECRLSEEQHWNIYLLYQSYLKSFGVHDLSQNVSSLSGGQQKKILLSLGLSSSSQLILWDEPTNHLDLETITIFEQELVQSKKTLMIISHDRYLLSRVCNKMCHIDDSQIKNYNGSYVEYLSYLDQKENERQKSLQVLQNSLRREDEWMKQGIKARGTRSKKRVENFVELKNNVSRIKSQERENLNLIFNLRNNKSKLLLEMQNLEIGYKEILFKDVNLTLYRGDKVGILGSNGVGKTTLLKIISQNKDVQDCIKAGKVKYFGDIKINYFSQDKKELDDNLTPRELLNDGEDFIHFGDQKYQHISTYFKKFLFTSEDLDKPVKSFSGGEKSRLQLALNLKQEADLLIFDEPTNDLDIESIEILERSLSQFKGSIILISHDRTFLQNVTNKIWLLKNKSLTNFAAGYTQVFPFIAAQEMEEKLMQEKYKNDLNKSKKSSKNILRDVSNSKKALKDLCVVIDKIEQQISRLESKIESFNYSVLDLDKQKNITKTIDLKEELEEKLLSLYEKQENLESKI